MRSTVHVVDPVTFKGWLAAKQAAKPAGATS
jgi:heme/copper-type cytochrome/quinol oxidase subunit 2